MGDKIIFWLVIALLMGLCSNTFSYIMKAQSATALLLPITPENAAQLAEISTLRGGHTGRVVSLAFNSDGNLLASGGANTILWDMQSKTELATIAEGSSAYSLGFSPDGQILASGECIFISTYLCNHTLRLWDLATGQDYVLSDDYSDTIIRVLFSPDGNTLAVASWDDVVQLWDVQGHEIRRDFQVYGVMNLMFNPDGDALTTATWQSSVQLWEIPTGENAIILPDQTGPVLTYSVAFSPDGRKVAFGKQQGTVQVWDLSTGEQLLLLEGHVGDVWHVAFSPDGAILASSSPTDTVRLWEVATGNELIVLDGSMLDIQSLIFSPDAKMLVTGGQDSAIRLWGVLASE